jgi:hypothetical protein
VQRDSFWARRPPVSGGGSPIWLAAVLLWLAPSLHERLLSLIGRQGSNLQPDRYERQGRDAGRRLFGIHSTVGPRLSPYVRTLRGYARWLCHASQVVLSIRYRALQGFVHSNPPLRRDRRTKTKIALECHDGRTLFGDWRSAPVRIPRVPEHGDRIRYLLHLAPVHQGARGRRVRRRKHPSCRRLRHLGVRGFRQSAPQGVFAQSVCGRRRAPVCRRSGHLRLRRRHFADLLSRRISAGRGMGAHLHHRSDHVVEPGDRREPRGLLQRDVGVLRHRDGSGACSVAPGAPARHSAVASVRVRDGRRACCGRALQSRGVAAPSDPEEIARVVGRRKTGLASDLRDRVRNIRSSWCSWARASSAR